MRKNSRHYLCRESCSFGVNHDNPGSKPTDIIIFRLHSMKFGGNLYYENTLALYIFSMGFWF